MAKPNYFIAAIPKSRFVIWLACQGGLKTKQRIMSMGMIDNDTYPICSIQTESVGHLFFKCEFSSQCVEALKDWLGFNWRVTTSKDLYRKCRMSKSIVRLIEATFCNLVWTIWSVRNEAVWHNQVRTFGKVVKSVKADTKTRVSSLSMSESTTTW